MEQLEGHAKAAHILVTWIFVCMCPWLSLAAWILQIAAHHSRNAYFLICLKMQHPFQAIVHLPPSDDQSPARGHLITACGPNILVVSLQEGIIISHWTCNETISHEAVDKDDTAMDGPPTKKQKIGKPALQASNNVIKLVVSSTHRHVVAVTEDKFIRVFELDDGKLHEVSQRCMPKRPCAIQITPDNASILCGDKFGDVYSLPLLPSEDQQEDTAVGATDPSQQREERFIPSANNFTVHSKRNRDVLEAQMKQKIFTPKKEALKFQHQLLLGHVSMLTDMKIVQPTDAKNRSYIITADRDEHIRISRGPPQAHIIEGFCLGHKEFISKICTIPGTEYLVSGGGDNWLGFWKWSSFELLEKIDLPRLMDLHSSDALDENEPKISQPAVAGLTTMRVPSETGHEQALVLWCEKVKAVWLLALSSLTRSFMPDSPGRAEISPRGTCIPLTQYPLDVVVSDGVLFVSVDEREVGRERIFPFKARKKHCNDPSDKIVVEPDEDTFKRLQTLNTYSGCEATAKQLDESLYSIADLRKRRDVAEEEVEEAEAIAKTATETQGEIEP